MADEKVKCNCSCDVCGPTMEDRIVPTVRFYDSVDDRALRICWPCIKKAHEMFERYNWRGLVLEGY